MDSKLKDLLLEKIMNAGKKKSQDSELLSHDHGISIEQKRILFLYQFSKEGGVSTVPCLFKIEGDLSLENLKECLQVIVSKHFILQSLFLKDSDDWHVVTQNNEVQLHEIHIEQDIDLNLNQDLILSQINYHFNLSEETPVRFTIIHTLKEKFLLCVFHHIAIDAWSIEIFKDELEDNFEKVQREPTKVPIQYSQYVNWQKNNQQKPDYYKSQLFWNDHLKGSSPYVSFPSDYRRPESKTYNGNSCQFEIPAAVVSDMSNISEEINITISSFCLTSLYLLLGIYSQEKDLTIGLPVAGRSQQVFNKTIGVFINILPLRVILEPEKNLKELLKEINTNVFNGLSHDCVSFEEIMKSQQCERRLDYSPLFQILYNFNSMTDNRKIHLGSAVLKEIPFKNTITKYDLTLYVEKTHDNRLLCDFSYNSDLFDSNTIETLITHYTVIISKLVKEPQIKLNELEILNNQEKYELLNEKSGFKTFSNGQSKTEPLHVLLEKQACHTPWRRALKCGDESISYRKLNQNANKIAHYLIKANTAESPIVIFLNRNKYLAYGLWGVIKSGVPYIPIDPVMPKKRIEALLQTSKASIVLTEQSLLSALPEASENKNYYSVEDILSEKFQLSCKNPNKTITVNSFLYIMYTSGSTGIPKGVCVTHSNYHYYIKSIKKKMKINGRKSFALISTYAADLSSTNLYIPLCSGGCVHMISHEMSVDPNSLASYFSKNKIDIIKMVPTQLTGLLKANEPKHIIPRRKIILAGEMCKWSLVKRIRELNPNCSIENHYGPTEATVSMLTNPIPVKTDIDRISYGENGVPLGTPINSAYIYILDANKNLVPNGVSGELYIGGRGIASSYYNDPVQSEESFISDPFHEESNLRIYKTGDKVRFNQQDKIEFLGRIDKQLKIKGYRVETGEIETVIEDSSGIEKACVCLVGKDLFAFVVVKPTMTYSQNNLKQELREKVPQYMIPQSIIQIDEIPKNVNNKIDQKRLKDIAKDYKEEYQSSILGDIEKLSPSELKIKEVFLEILNISNISKFESFFDHGGDSFLAIRICSKMFKKIRLIDFFKNPSISELAAFLDNQNNEMGLTNLIPLEVNPKNTSLPSIVCVPYGGGSSITFTEMGKELKESFNVYAIQIPGHDFSNMTEAFIPIPDLAKKIVQEIKNTISGDIFILGHCVGGALATAISQQLVLEKLPLKGIFQAGNFPCPRPPGKIMEFIYKKLNFERFVSSKHYKDMFTSMGSEVKSLNKNETTHLLKAMRFDATQAEEFYSNDMYSKDGPFNCQVPLICIAGSMDPVSEFSEERYKEWEDYGSYVELEIVPGGGHYFHKTQPVETAKIIKNQLKLFSQEPTESIRISSSTDQKSKKKWSLSTFLIIILGQFVSLIGSALSIFAVGIWVLNQTGKVLDFAVISTFALLPGILALPFSGYIADRFSKKKVMIISDTVAAFGTLTLLIAYSFNFLSMPLIFIAASLSSIGTAFQRPAYLAAITQLVPKQFLGQANGIINLTVSLSEFIAPLLGGLLVLLINLKWIFILDLGSFLFALITLASITIPKRLFRKSKESFWKELIGGIRFIKQRKSMIAMVLYFVAFNFFISIAGVLITPYILSLGDSFDLGKVLAFGGFGGIVGALIMSIWGGFRRRSFGMVGFSLLTGVSLILLIFNASYIMAGIGVFLFAASLILINSHWQSLIQIKVHAELQGRVFAANQMLTWSIMPIGYLLAGLLSDKFIPLAQSYFKDKFDFFGLLSMNSLPLTIAISGFFVIIVGIISFAYSPLRKMDSLLPNIIHMDKIPENRDALQKMADQGIVSTNE